MESRIKREDGERVPSIVVLFFLFICLLHINNVYAVDSLKVHWSTYVGGNGGQADCVHNMATDNMGNIYLVGNTESTDMPQRTNEKNPTASWSAYVSKLDTSGSIHWTTYVAGSRNSSGLDIVVDNTGENVYITGNTGANDLPQVLVPGWGAGIFVTKLSADNGQIKWSRILSESDSRDTGQAIFIDKHGYIYITGHSSGGSLVNVTNSYAGGDWDTFISKLTSTGDVVESVWFGGSKRDNAQDIFVDDEGNIYITGDIFWAAYQTGDYDMPKALNSWHNDWGSTMEGFLCKMNSSFDVEWTLYVGGKHDDYPTDVLVDDLGYIYVSGWAYSHDMNGPIIDKHNGEAWDGFITKINSLGNVQWSSYCGHWQGTANDPQLTPCGKIMVISKRSLKMFDSDLGNHQWAIGNQDFLLCSPNSLNDFFMDEYMNIYVCGSTVYDNLPNRTNEHSGLSGDVYVAKLSPKGHFFHFNDVYNGLPPGWISRSPETCWSVKEGKMVFEPIGGNYVRIAYLDQNFFNFTFQVQCTKTEDNLQSYGLIFKDNANRAEIYRFGISIDGSYYVNMWDGQSWINHIDWTFTPFVKEGVNQCNLLKIVARDSVIEFYANGAYLNEIKETNLFTGRVGLFVVDLDGIRSSVEFDNFYICEYPGEPPVTDVEVVNASDLPSDFMLSQNYPNPFNPQTEIQYTIPKKSRIQLKIYNTLGEDVISLVNEEKLAGTYKVQWNGKNEQGNSLPSGLYYYCLKADNMIISTNKMILLR